MSDTRRVRSDTRVAEMSMQALADTEGMTAPERAEFWLQGLAWAKHRGRYDTWTAARDNAAKEAKLPLSVAKRIWQRWQNMNDVSGEALLKLMLAYEEMCVRNEEAAAAYRAERLSIRRNNHEEAGQKPLEKSVGTNAPSHRTAA